MNSRNAFGSNSNAAAKPPDSGEATLRLIAQLPPPKGLEKRVLASLETAPRSGRILSWPRALQPSEAWMRSAAAAAIVFVVAGGGWSIYMRVQPLKPGTTVAAPAQAGGFSSAGAMRMPQTVTGPVIAKPADTQTKTDKSAPVASRARHRVHEAAASKTPGQPAVAAAK